MHRGLAPLRRSISLGRWLGLAKSFGFFAGYVFESLSTYHRCKGAICVAYQAAGITQSQAAEQLGLSRQQVAIRPIEWVLWVVSSAQALSDAVRNLSRAAVFLRQIASCMASARE